MQKLHKFKHHIQKVSLYLAELLIAIKHNLIHSKKDQYILVRQKQ